MTNASEIIALLNGFRNHCLQAGCADVLDDAIELIERATKPMTIEQVLKILSDNEKGDGFCEVRDGRVVFTYEDEPKYFYDSLSIKQAFAYAEKIVREKEAGVG